MLWLYHKYQWLAKEGTRFREEAGPRVIQQSYLELSEVWKNSRSKDRGLVRIIKLTLNLEFLSGKDYL